MIRCIHHDSDRSWHIPLTAGTLESMIFRLFLGGICACTGMSMVLSKWIITPIKVGCKSRK